jgi:hypothetical protein
VGKAVRAITERLHAPYDCTAVFWNAYSNADKTTKRVVPQYTDYPINATSHVYFDLLVWKAMALGAYSAKIQESFPSENDAHLYLSESANAESVQWLSHMCIDYVFPGNRNIDHFYKGCLGDT